MMRVYVCESETASGAEETRGEAESERAKDTTTPSVYVENMRDWDGDERCALAKVMADQRYMKIHDETFDMCVHMCDEANPSNNFVMDEMWNGIYIMLDGAGDDIWRQLQLNFCFFYLYEHLSQRLWQIHFRESEREQWEENSKKKMWIFQCLLVVG